MPLLSELEWLKPAELAEYIRVPRSRIWSLVRAGRLPPPHYQYGPKSPRYNRRIVDEMSNGRSKTESVDEVIAGAIDAILNKETARRKKTTR